MAHSITNLAQALGGTVEGDSSLTVVGATEPGRAAPDELAVALTPSFIEQIPSGKALVALLPEGTNWQRLGLSAAILVYSGRATMAPLTAAFVAPDEPAAHHPTAEVKGAKLGGGVGLGAFTVIGYGAVIGDGTRLGHHVTIAPGAVIGSNVVIHDGVRIGPKVRIGDGSRLHPNVVIGADGFSFVSPMRTQVDAVRETLGAASDPQLKTSAWQKIHSLGGVEIGAEVEIGSGSTVDAGTLRPTRIGDRTKVDNLVQIGHNVRVGTDCLICAQAGIAGSTDVGDRTVIGGKAGIADNLTVGSDVVLGGGTIVLANVPNGRIMLGYPAMPMDRHIASYKALRRLPRLLGRLFGREKPGSQDASE